jgi:uncharacterized 2Fe-2S/4Fe-4S cluster protein (DUF4445 family)
LPAITLPPDPRRPLRDRLFDLGVEFPCGGETGCGGCKVRVLAGEVPVTPLMRSVLTEEELAAGWRLGCEAASPGEVTLDVEQWSPVILSDNAPMPVESRPGKGAAIDLGTTTLVAQRVDLATGNVEAVETAINPQARHGADLMSRIRFEMERPGVLRALIHEVLSLMLDRLAPEEGFEEILICGNTAMHHLCCGFDVSPLAAVPFVSPNLRSAEVMLGRRRAVFLPCLGGFVGSDLTAGAIAAALDAAPGITALTDLGTNGEILIGSSQGILCASTAAGPAFEGGRISRGMRAAAGAIDAVHVSDDSFTVRVLGDAPARGICGSGLVDAISASLARGLLRPNGRLNCGAAIQLAPEVSITQSDVRELQLAKGAIAAGLALLSRELGAVPQRLWLAGAFGNSIHIPAARAIGLLPEGIEITPVGNSALRGTRALLLQPSTRGERLSRLLGICRHVELASLPGFADAYAASMALAPFQLPGM